MNRPRRWILSVGVLLISLSACATLSPRPAPSVEVAVEHLLEAIDTGTEIAFSRHQQVEGLKITDLTVELQTSVDRQSSQDVTISILEIDAGEETTHTQTLTLDLEPPTHADGQLPTPAESTRHPRLTHDLANAIDAAIHAVRGAHRGLAGLSPSDSPLSLHKITAAITFAVETTGEGIPSISVLGIDLTAQQTRSRTHTITLKLEIPSAPKDTTTSAGP